jgi:dihydroorotate dehydrogenase
MPALYRVLRPLIFRMRPEAAHGVTIALLRFAGGVAPARALARLACAPSMAAHPVHAFGLTFSNPVGLAAGYDKDGLAWQGLAALPFGHLELGTVTPRAQPGNPRPRVFRLVDEEAIINRMGFPGRGADFLARRLAHRPARGPIIGVNIGKNKETPLEAAAQDYASLVQTFAPLADYLAVNISSPNTPGLRSLQSGDALSQLLVAVAAARRQMADQLGRLVPVLVKVAPDLDAAGLETALDVICAAGMDGVIVANTTLARDGLSSPFASETGGLSGRPLGARNTELVRLAVGMLGGRLPVIASGGVMQPADAREKLDAGAALIQLYTGLIYHGPGLVAAVVDALA